MYAITFKENIKVIVNNFIVSLSVFATFAGATTSVLNLCVCGFISCVADFFHEQIYDKNKCFSIKMLYFHCATLYDNL